MAKIKNEAKHRWLARAIGAGLLASFGVAMYQMSVVDDGALVAAAEADVDALTSVLKTRATVDLAMTGLTVFVAISFYLLLRPVNGTLSLFASALRLIGAGFSAFGAYAAYALMGDVSTGSPDSYLLAIEALNNANFDLFHWNLILSSVAAAINFALLFVARLVPRVLAGYGVIASIGATVGASAIYLAPPLSELMYPAYVAANALAFISLMLWLLIVGVDVRYWNAKT